jgi:hypothetical protein
MVLDNGTESVPLSNPQLGITNFAINPIYDKDLNIIGVTINIMFDSEKTGATREFHSSYLLK